MCKPTKCHAGPAGVDHRRKVITHITRDLESSGRNIVNRPHRIHEVVHGTAADPLGAVLSDSRRRSLEFFVHAEVIKVAVVTLQ